MADKKGDDGEVKAIRDNEGDENQNMAAWNQNSENSAISFAYPRYYIFIFFLLFYTHNYEFNQITCHAMPWPKKKKKNCVIFRSSRCESTNEGSWNMWK